jgi:ribonuclease P protein component
MFKKQHRLHTSEFKEVFNFGKTIKHSLFVIKTKENKLTHSRFAVVVSKKLFKKAHDRNYLKRKTIHALKEVEKQLPKNDYIFILSFDAKDIQYKDLVNNLRKVNI